MACPVILVRLFSPPAAHWKNCYVATCCKVGSSTSPPITMDRTSCPKIRPQHPAFGIAHGPGIFFIVVTSSPVDPLPELLQAFLWSLHLKTQATGLIAMLDTGKTATPPRLWLDEVRECHSHFDDSFTKRLQFMHRPRQRM